MYNYLKYYFHLSIFIAFSMVRPVCPVCPVCRQAGDRQATGRWNALHHIGCYTEIWLRHFKRGLKIKPSINTAIKIVFEFIDFPFNFYPFDNLWLNLSTIKTST